MSTRRLELKISPERAGVRLNTILRVDLGLSGTVIRRIKWLEDGILVDGVRVNTRHCPTAGQIVSVRLSEQERRSGIVSAPGELDIVYEDADIVVINKAPFVTVHPGPGHYDDTMGNFLLDYYEKTGVEGDFHPVHRLDRGTTGLMLVAKHPHAQEVLKNQLHTDSFRRSYLAVCEGIPNPSEGIVDAPLGIAEGEKLKRIVRTDGQSARTHYAVVKNMGERALLRLQLDTGRTHQIRVHMAHLGNPLVGDFLYGAEVEGLGRPALHSAEVDFIHPITGNEMHFTAPVPADILALIK